MESVLYILKQWGVKKIKVMSLIATKYGSSQPGVPAVLSLHWWVFATALNKVAKANPDVQFHVGAIDDGDSSVRVTAVGFFCVVVMMPLVWPCRPPWAQVLVTAATVCSVLMIARCVCDRFSLCVWSMNQLIDAENAAVAASEAKPVVATPAEDGKGAKGKGTKRGRA
jgi:hypothetical protein